MYKVFFNDRTIYLDDSLPDMSRVGNDYVCAFENITDLKPQVRQFLSPDKTGNLYIFHDDDESLLKTFRQCFRNVKAGGGLVRNRKGEVLVIFRRGAWDLPKGKLEPGESMEQAALREVEEECGLSGLQLGELVRTTYHIYQENGVYILKQTDWYSMLYHGDAEPVPLQAEQITDARWLDPGGMDEILSNTFRSIAELLETVH